MEYEQKFIKNVKNDQFWKAEACGQTVLPDRLILIRQKLAENAKAKNSDDTFRVISKQCGGTFKAKMQRILIAVTINLFKCIYFPQIQTF